MKDRKYSRIAINDLTVEYYVEYRNVKYTRYELIHGRLRLVTQRRNKNRIEELIHEKDRWIYSKIIKHRQLRAKNEDLTKDKQLCSRTPVQLKRLVDNYVEVYGRKLNVKVNRIQYRSMIRKWGSCSSLHNITLSKDLRFLPDRLVEYIVYHEMAHLIVMAHDDKFFEIIKREFENYKRYDEELEQYYYLLNKRLYD